MTMDRLGTSADIIVTQLAMEQIISSAEDEARSVPLKGNVGEDASGRFYELSGIGGQNVGFIATSEEGGTSANPEVVESIRGSMSEGILIMVDPYAGELVFYLVDGEEVKSASVVMSE